MATSIISIRSKELQSRLGVTTTRSVRRKLQKFGAVIVDGEYVDENELAHLMATKRRQATDSAGSAPTDWVKGSSFEELID